METTTIETNETHKAFLGFSVMDLSGASLGNVILGFDDEEDGNELGYKTVKNWLDANKGKLGASSGLINGGVLADELRPPDEYLGRFLDDAEFREVLDIFKAQRNSAAVGAN